MVKRRYVLGGTLLTIMLSSASASSQTETEEPQPEESEPADSAWRRPLNSRNQFPLSLLFVSLAPDKASALVDGRTALDIGFDYSNIISGQESEDEVLHLDLEYLRTTAAVRRGLPKRIELGVSIPFYVYYGGFLDPVVDGFHELFDLPNFLRGQTEHGQARYELVTRGGAPFVGDGSVTSVGDVTVHFKKTLVEKNLWAFAARTDLKLPTGSPDSLSGSGSAGVGFGGALDRIADRWGLYVNANYHVLGQPERVRAKNFFSFMVGFDWRFKPTLTAHLQYDHARPSIDGDLPIFNDGAQQLALGLRWRHSDRFVYEWRFVEDFSDVSPDFSIAFQLGVRWDREKETTTP